MSRRKGWKDCHEYKRVLQILSDYWGTEPDEAYVRIDMWFAHKNGEVQGKNIIWWNPNLSADVYETLRKKDLL